MYRYRNRKKIFFGLIPSPIIARDDDDDDLVMQKSSQPWLRKFYKMLNTDLKQNFLHKHHDLFLTGTGKKNREHFSSLTASN